MDDDAKLCTKSIYNAASVIVLNLSHYAIENVCVIQNRLYIQVPKRCKCPQGAIKHTLGMYIVEMIVVFSLPLVQTEGTVPQQTGGRVHQGEGLHQAGRQPPPGGLQTGGGPH